MRQRKANLKHITGLFAENNSIEESFNIARGLVKEAKARLDFGRRLGLPYQRSAQVLYHNTAWAHELGFTALPVTPDQFRQQVCEAAWANRNDDSIDNDGTGGWIISTNYATALSWIFSFGGEVASLTESAQEPYHFNSPQADEAFAYLRDLYDTHCAWVSENPYPEAEFARRLGLVSTGSVMDITYRCRLSSTSETAINGRLSHTLPPTKRQH